MRAFELAAGHDGWDRTEPAVASPSAGSAATPRDWSARERHGSVRRALPADVRAAPTRGRNAIESSAPPPTQPGYGRSSSTCLGLSGSPCRASASDAVIVAIATTPRAMQARSILPWCLPNDSPQSAFVAASRAIRLRRRRPRCYDQSVARTAEASDRPGHRNRGGSERRRLTVRVGGRLTLVGLTGFEPATT